ncbi:MAG: hypothetical protein BWZ10_01194 [candidate division BRC1 bacterium ADurb.BinA364]|nr:MAG: hypothetical protein BWZ10_01194 [candidate division BRC1 bacterium ADurb.BinA364]
MPSDAEFGGGGFGAAWRRIAYRGQAHAILHIRLAQMHHGAANADRARAHNAHSHSLHRCVLSVLFEDAMEPPDNEAGPSAAIREWRRG